MGYKISLFFVGGSQTKLWVWFTHWHTCYGISTIVMALYKYLRPVDNSLLDPHGPLVFSEVNRQVTAVQALQEQTNKRGEYLKFSEERATVACYASENGVATAVRHFKPSNVLINVITSHHHITRERPFRHHFSHLNIKNTLFNLQLK